MWWWPYSIHIRSKTWVYLIMVLMFLYLWHMFAADDVHKLIRSRPRMQYVNFKHLLIACVLAAQKGGHEVIKARQKDQSLEIDIKGKTKEGVLDLLTTGDKRSNVMMVNSLLYTIPGIKIISEENIQNDDIIELLKIDRYLSSEEYATIPDDIQMKVDDLVIWIDPLDATKEYSEGLTKYVTTMVCVAAKNGEPIIGVIHQPFAKKTYWATKFGIDKKLLSKKFSQNLQSSNSSMTNRPLRIIISRSHKGNIEQWLRGHGPFHTAILAQWTNFTLIEAAGSGFKTIQLLQDNADIYLHRTYIKKWDICAPNVLMKYASNGGEMITLNGDHKAIDYSFQTNFINRLGLFATKYSNLVYIRDILNES